MDLEAGARPVFEVLRSLSSAAKLPLKAPTELAEEKVTVLFTSMPLPEAARALAAALDAVWVERRHPRTGRKEYHLEPTKRRTERLARYRNARRAAEAARDRQALAVLLLNLSGRAPEPKGPDVLKNPPLFLRPKPIYPLVRSLPRASLELLVAGANDAFSTVNGGGPDNTPVLTLPGRSLSADQRRLLQSFVRDSARESANKGEVGLRRSQDKLADLGRPEGFLLDFWSFRFEAPHGLAMDIFLRLRAPEDRWGQDLQLAKARGHPITEPLEDLRYLAPSRPVFTDPARERSVLSLKYGPARLDQALLELARASKVNLVADYYTKPGDIPVNGSGRSLAGWLGQVEKSHSLAHFWQGPTLVIRSRDWPRATDREPTASVTDHLDARQRKAGALGFDEYLYAANALRDSQLATLFNHADQHGRRLYQRDVPRLTRYRHVLRGFAALTDPQRRLLRSDAGLPVAALTPSQLERWRPALRRFSLFPPASFNHAGLKISSVPEGSGPLPDFLLLGLPELPEVELAVNRR
ncbi:MAG: hypothetical protein ACO1SX_04370 [Actinomycetota bacterium]